MPLIEYIYWLAGALLAITAFFDIRERRWTNAAFWGTLAVIFFTGRLVASATAAGIAWPAQAVGVAVVVLSVLVGIGKVKRADHVVDVAAADARVANAKRLGHRLFVPALLIPAIVAAFVVAVKIGNATGVTAIDLTQASYTFAALAVACGIAFFVATRVTRIGVTDGLREHRRLLDMLGWAAVLPMLLATLGDIFAATGVGDAIASITGGIIAVDNRLACVLAYGLGMVAFTVIMGNAFAAFPVMTGGIALPLLIGRHGADPAVVGALGMLTGYCGTLLTPMAANFNIVPAALLELRDQYGVIRMQWPTAVALLTTNLVLLYVLAFR
jgi:uncharacterized membrane protein